MPVQGNQQPTNPYAPTGKNVGARSVQEIQWDIDNTPAHSWGNPRILQDELASAQYTEGRKKSFEQLRKDGYTGSASGKGFQQTSNFGTGGKWGNTTYGDAYANAKATGNWSQIDQMLHFADNNPRERSGLFGTGISISPFQAFTLGAGGFLAAGGLGGVFGLPGSSPVSGGFTNASALGGSLPPSTFGSIGTVGGAATTGAGTVGSLGSGFGSLGSLGGSVASTLPLSGLSAANAGWAGGTNGSSVLTAKNTIRAAKLANGLFGGGGDEGTLAQEQNAAQQAIPNISQSSPNFRNSIQDRLNLNTQLPQQQHRPFMTVQEMFNQRNA
jgi:hypothetical protein